MEIFTKFNRFFVEWADYIGTAVRFLLNILLIIIVLALAVGVFKTGEDLVNSLNRPLESLLQNLLVDIVFIVALVEISITVLNYLKEGKVHVRYIVDTILIIMLNEVVGLWFTKPKFMEVASLTLIVFVLAAVRIMVTKFQPEDKSP